MAAVATTYRMEQKQKERRFEEIIGNSPALQQLLEGGIPLESQPKLLRVLQEREFERVGSCRTQKVDLRVVAATHRELGDMVRSKQFRSLSPERLSAPAAAVSSRRAHGSSLPLHPAIEARLP